MAAPPPIAPLTGELSWRPASIADADSISTLYDRCFEVDRGYRITAGEVRTELKLPDGDPRSDTMLGVTADGEIVALAWVIVPAGATTTFRVFDWNCVRPDYRGKGLGSYLLSWWEQRGRERSIESPLPGVYRQHPYDWQHDRIELLEANGYRPQRYFTELARDLSAAVPDPVFPRGVRVAPWASAVSESARRVSNAAFVDHWGSEPMESERWEAWQDEFFDFDASAVVFAGEEPVALITCAIYEQDFEDRGRSEGWIERLGTVRQHRSRGLATALINRALGSFSDRDIEYAVLGVDAANPTGALSLYERLGFMAEKVGVAYVKPITS